MHHKYAFRANPPSLPADGRLRIAIVGRGFAGTITAIALLRRLRQPFHLWMIDVADQSGGLGRGAAGQALMSECAGQLSALADRPADFVDWLQDNLAGGRGGVAPIRGFENVYLPRSVFRDYLVARFGEAFASRRDVTVQIVTAAVTAMHNVENGRHALVFADGDSMLFDHVFAATGHGTDSSEASSWYAAEAALRGRPRAERTLPILLSGDGPRMTAILLHLRASGYGGPIRILAPGGLLPQQHGERPAEAVVPAVSAGTGLAETLRHLREDCTQLIGGSWRELADGLNGQWPSLWRALPLEAQRRYWRHLRCVHRNRTERIAPELHRRFVRELDNPATTVSSARVVGTFSGGILLPTAAGQEPAAVRGQYIDCREEVARSADGLLDRQRSGLPMRVEDDGRLMRGGVALPGLHVIGRAAGELRPDVRLLADTVRQIYRAAIGLEGRLAAAVPGG